MTGKLLPSTTIVKSRDLLKGTYDAQDRMRYDAVEAVWHDLNTGLDAVETAGTGDKVYRIRTPYPTQAEAMRAANARYARYAAGKASLHLTIIGNPNLRAEAPITLDGFNPDVPKDWITTQITHTLDGGGFRTEVEAELPRP